MWPCQHHASIPHAAMRASHLANHGGPCYLELATGNFLFGAIRQAPRVEREAPFVVDSTTVTHRPAQGGFAYEGRLLGLDVPWIPGPLEIRSTALDGSRPISLWRV
ncbi:hypothetical protein N7492_005743 [Penicillium capsulatum]|uniref:Uncharacterized protein n=1 Tax=Penicillium capsulatum TaxID=69766 RepID=A0A9W9ICU3_9EURO|nr:hypothetical protein N7492_005743 [Penicillium capsulatum]